MAPATRVLSYVRSSTPSVSMAVGILSLAWASILTIRPFSTVASKGP